MTTHPAQADEAKGMTDERDLAHEADMRELMREQLEADCGGEMADEPDDEDDFMGDPDDYDDYDEISDQQVRDQDELFGVMPEEPKS